MKRVIERYKGIFIKENGEPTSFTSVDLYFGEIPIDCNFDGYEVNVINVLHDDCYIKVTGFDENENSIRISIPKWIKEILFLAHRQGENKCISLLKKLRYESDLIKNKEPIPYSNTVS